MDFPAEYAASKKFTSCVRRRKWIRYRKYIAIDTWSAVPGVGEDTCPMDKSQFFQKKPQSSFEQEPFLDLAIGGNEIPGMYLKVVDFQKVFPIQEETLALWTKFMFFPLQQELFKY